MPFNIIHPPPWFPRPNICSNLMMVGLFQHSSRISESFCPLIVCPSQYLLYFHWPNSYWFVRYSLVISSLFVSSFLQFMGEFDVWVETWSDLSESYNSLLPPQLMRSWWHYSASFLLQESFHSGLEYFLWIAWRQLSLTIDYFCSASWIKEKQWSQFDNNLTRWLSLNESESWKIFSNQRELSLSLSHIQTMRKRSFNYLITFSDLYNSCLKRFEFVLGILALLSLCCLLIRILPCYHQILYSSIV